MGENTIARVAVVAAVAAALVVSAAGCAGEKPSEAECQTVSAPLSDVPTRTDQEPRMRVPVPAGWERSTKLDSEGIRFAIRSPALAADGFTPNAVVTLQRVRSDLGRPEQLLQAQNDKIAKDLDVKDMETTPAQVCGATALSTSYTVPEVKLGPKAPTIPPRRATSLGAVYRAGDSTYVAMLTVQTVKADDKTYATDSQMILNGFQLLPPG